MPPTLIDLLWIFLKAVGIIVAIDLVLAYLIWRVRGISRAQEYRRRRKIAQRREERRIGEARIAYEAAKKAVDLGVISTNDVRTAVLPRIPQQPPREERKHRAIR